MMNVKRTSLILPALVAVLVAVAALALRNQPASSSRATSSSGKTRSGSVKIVIENFAYHPASVTVTAGTKITFTDEDDVEHTATSNAEGVFETGTLEQGKSASFTLSKPGTYAYHCAFHAFMHGTITVVK